MHSHMRATQGEVVSLGYCPLDLFSNDEGRISNAIRALWDAWNDSNGTINNFKVFVHGRLIQPSDVNSSLNDTLRMFILGLDVLYERQRGCL
jgi:inositol-pentakisphosphate 2-kinase